MRARGFPGYGRHRDRRTPARRRRRRRRLASIARHRSELRQGSGGNCERVLRQPIRERLPAESEGTLLVSAADKVYNAHSMLEDYRELGPALWKNFKRGRDKQLWYFTELIKVYEK